MWAGGVSAKGSNWAPRPQGVREGKDVGACGLIRATTEIYKAFIDLYYKMF